MVKIIDMHRLQASISPLLRMISSDNSFQEVAITSSMMKRIRIQNGSELNSHGFQMIWIVMHQLQSDDQCQKRIPKKGSGFVVLRKKFLRIHIYTVYIYIHIYLVK